MVHNIAATVNQILEHPKTEWETAIILPIFSHICTISNSEMIFFFVQRTKQNQVFSISYKIFQTECFSCITIETKKGKKMPQLIEYRA